MERQHSLFMKQTNKQRSSWLGAGLPGLHQSNQIKFICRSNKM